MTIDTSARGGLTDAVTYSRIAPNTSRTDPFSGLCLGAFGPHGPELLQLQRSRDDAGDDWVSGIKLTGAHRLRKHRELLREWATEFGVRGC